MIDKNDSRLTDFVLGELSPAETAEIQNAIDNSAELQSVVDEIRQTALMLNAAYQAESPLRLHEEQKAELEQMQIEDAARQLNRSSSERPWLPIVLAASLLALLVGGAIYLQDPPPSPEMHARNERFENMDTSQLKGLKDRADAENLSEMKKLAKDVDQTIDGKGFRGAEKPAGNYGGLVQKSKTQEKSNESDAIEEEHFQRLGRALPRDRAEWKEGEAAKTESAGENRDEIKKMLVMENDSKTDGKSEAQVFRAPLIARSNQLNDDRASGKSLGRAGSVDDEDSDMESSGAITSSTPEVLATEQDAAASDAYFEKMKLRRKFESIRPQSQGQNFGDEGKNELSSLDETEMPADAFKSGGLGGRGGGFGAGEGGGFGGGGFGESGKFSEEREDEQSGGRGIAQQESEPMRRPALRLDRGGEDGQGEGGDSGVQDNSQSSLRSKALGGMGFIPVRGQPESTPAPAKSPADNDSLKMEIGDALGQQNQTPSDENKNAADGQAGDGGAMSELEKQLSKQVTSGAQRGANSASAQPSTEPAESLVAGAQIVKEGETNRPAAAAKEETSDTEKAESLKRSRITKQLAELEELGARVETRMQTQQKTQVVPVQRMRSEPRTRRVELDNGTTEMQEYTIDVPYIVNVTQRYSVQVPHTILVIEPQTSDSLVDKLANRIDPRGSREIKIGQLFDKARELKEAQSPENGEADKDLLLAFELREHLVEESEDEFDLDITPALKTVENALKRRNAKVRKTRTWKRVKAIPNTTRMMVGDKDELDLTGMQVNVQVDGFRARVLLDYFYYNDRGRALDGNFKLRLPDDASLYFFAFGESSYDLSPKGDLATKEFLDDGTQFVSLRADKIRDARKNAWSKVKESRMVPREKAAHAYIETARRKVDPALAEWSGAGVFNAQVSPLAPHKLHRIVIGYDVNLKKADGDLIYELDLPEQTGQCQVDISVQPIDGVEYSIEPKSDPFENVIGGKTQRRYRFKGPQKETIRLTASKSPEILLASAEEFWGVQTTPDLPVENVAGNPRAVFLVDTSLSSNPDKFNVWLNLLESTLENNRDSLKQFNVVFFNVDAQFWQEKWVDNTQENTQLLLEKCNTLALEGATDLYGAINRISKSDWIYGSGKAAGKPAPGPDLFLLSDGAANWGETNLRLIGSQLQDNQLGSLFAYQTGFTGTAISGLRFLAGQSGGAVFSVANEDEVKIASTAHRKRPWKLTAIKADGATDVMTAGRVQWVYPGQAITVVGRGDVKGALKLELEQSGQTKIVSVSPTRLESELASRLYGQVAVGQLESLGAKVFDVAASYARHFRVTGDTCSLLMLESEADYRRFDIKPHEDLFVIKTKEAKDLIADTLRESASELADPKAQLMAWLGRLETMPGMSFKMPTALKLALDDIKVVAISKPLDCSLATKDGLSKEYLAAIQNERLDYELIAREANRRGGTSVDDAIKVFSSLVERNPGDLVIARDVAFAALEMGRPAQAYHLLRSVARARPFEGSIYPALGQCLTQLGQSDMAVVYYEIALSGSFSRMGADFQKIVSAEYMYLLRQIVDGKLDSSVKDFAEARLETLKKNLHFDSANLLITMMWNTDQTDVDLHIVEPSGEECSYENKKTRSGGQITSDITTGYGPEMYSNPNAPGGKYNIKVKYFASNQNRTEMRNKVHLTIYRGFGTPKEQVTRRTVQLKTVGEKELVATIGVD